MGTVKFNIPYIYFHLRYFTCKNRFNFIKSVRRFIYIFNLSRTSVFKGKFCTVITIKSKLSRYSNTAQGGFKLSTNICVSKATGIPVSARF